MWKYEQLILRVRMPKQNALHNGIFLLTFEKHGGFSALLKNFSFKRVQIASPSVPLSCPHEQDSIQVFFLLS